MDFKEVIRFIGHLEEMSQYLENFEHFFKIYSAIFSPR